MNFSEKFTLAATPVARYVYTSLPFPGISHPIFIIGCGRSGTTIFGESLSKHKDVTYLNEPRELWSSIYPNTDIWTEEAPSRQGKIHFTELDVERKKSARLRREFRFETILSRRPYLIEKLPINNFRLKFIHRIFPDARFIHIYRNGLEVASSIETLIAQNRWYGKNNYKWGRLLDYTEAREDVRNLPSLCETDFDKGLLEWRLSTEEAVGFLGSLNDNSYFELSYSELMDNPVATLQQVMDFIGIDRDQAVEKFVAHTLKRRTTKLNEATLSEKEQLIGGKLLPLSIDGKKELTKRCT